MIINDILRLKFPGVDFLKDIILQDDGEGVYIKEWNLNSPMPTQADIEKWAIELDLEYRQHLARKARIYPPISEQLDMQYHDFIKGTTTWADTIEAIKIANPIPTE